MTAIELGNDERQMIAKLLRDKAAAERERAATTKGITPRHAIKLERLADKIG